uniref:Uncharacterized protein n=1 Tax=Schistocephalus solidus TaxID=70667 RepID=A0A0X3Q2Z3_SCHSO
MCVRFSEDTHLWIHKMHPQNRFSQCHLHLLQTLACGFEGISSYTLTRTASNKITHFLLTPILLLSKEPHVTLKNDTVIHVKTSNRTALGRIFSIRSWNA